MREVASGETRSSRQNSGGRWLVLKALGVMLSEGETSVDKVTHLTDVTKEGKILM